MGLEVRLNKLITMARDDRRKHIKEGAERLIDPLGMGSQYQVMGIVPSEGSETDVYPFAPLSQNLRT
jgi:NADH dehydrogenase [ubiquinone] 1 alpha subcomplex assembly factor 7